VLYDDVVTEELDVEYELVDTEVVVTEDEDVETEVVVVNSPAPDSQPQTVTKPPVALVVILSFLSGSLEHLGIGNGITTFAFAAKAPLKTLSISLSDSSYIETVQAAEVFILIQEIINLFPDCGVQMVASVTPPDQS